MRLPVLSTTARATRFHRNAIASSLDLMFPSTRFGIGFDAQLADKRIGLAASPKRHRFANTRTRSRATLGNRRGMNFIDWLPKSGSRGHLSDRTLRSVEVALGIAKADETWRCVSRGRFDFDTSSWLARSTVVKKAPARSSAYGAALDRVREAARQRKKGQFTALLHHPRDDDCPRSKRSSLRFFGPRHR